ncbi:MAG: hypothetical protein ACPGOV_06815 [Magnetovibrionaceae bacterium]
MLTAIEQMLALFGFTKLQYLIGFICILLFLLSFLGGMIVSSVLAFGGPFKDRPLTTRTSFRLMLAGELGLLVFAAYYHLLVISKIDMAHIIYWIFAIATAPVLGYIGSQITYLTFQSKIEKNKELYRKWELKQKKKRMKAAAARRRKAIAAG